MSFFNKKKRFNEVEGYERISRLIEDRQREVTGDEIDMDDFEGESVVLSPSSRSSRPALPAPADADPSGPSQAPRFLEGGNAPPERSQGVAPTVQLARPPSAMFGAGAVQPIVVAPPPASLMPQGAARMAVPDMGAAAGTAVSLVSADAVWTGKLQCGGDVRIEGRVEGEIETSATLYVVAQARINGTVRARNVMLAGEIEGQLRCEDRLEILPGGSARGEIDTGALVVHEGAFIESKFQMRRDASPARGS